MRTRGSGAELYGAVEQIRGAAADFTTNLYATRAEMRAWSFTGALWQVCRPGCVLAFRSDHDFERLYFAASDKQQLADALAIIESYPGAPIVTDLVGPTEES